MSAANILNRGIKRAEKGANAAALADLEKVLSEDSKNVPALYYRGLVLSQMGSDFQAIAAFGDCIAVDNKHAGAYRARGVLYSKSNHYHEALADFDQATKLEPQNPLFANDLAWLLATCPDDLIRDGDRAIQYANTAMTFGGSKWEYLDTYAAALAETGNYREATEILLATEYSVPSHKASDYRKHLESYEDRKPWREGKPEVELPDIFN